MRPELRAISTLLPQRDAAGSFAVRLAARSAALNLTIQKQYLSLPVKPEQADWLCGLARPARHGYKDEMRLDPTVRDTWEIPGEQIVLYAPDWQRLLDRALEQIRAGLGVPRGCQLRPQLHNLLIYRPGQFFAPHQDTGEVARDDRHPGGDAAVVLQRRRSDDPA